MTVKGSNTKEIWDDAPVNTPPAMNISFMIFNLLSCLLLKEDLGEDILKLKTEDIVARTRLLENETKILKSEIMRISHEHQSQKEKIKENKEKIKLNKTLPYLVSNVIEVN